MSVPSVDAPASAVVPKLGNVAGRTFVKTLLLVTTLVSGCLSALPANAGLLITTTGTILSGSETGGLFGLPNATTSLAGDRYTLSVYYSSLGPNYFSTGDGSFAQDAETPGTTGFVNATINGHLLTTPLTTSLGSLLIADMFDFFASNQGHNGSSSTGAFVNVSQSLSCTNACVPNADLKSPISYNLGPNDFGTDLFTFEGAGFPAPGTATANFVGTEATFAVVPEPASWALLAIGLLVLLILRRRA